MSINALPFPLPTPPLIAILRGLPKADAAQVGAILFAAGFQLLEVPLNRPEALECITILSQIAPAGSVVGAGTVLRAEQVDAVKAAGGRLIVSPNCDSAVIRHTVASGLLSAPGVATPTEAFAALKAGAHILKIFPADAVGLAGITAMKSVLPARTLIYPVGGITPASFSHYQKLAVNGFGIGSALYQPSMSMTALQDRAEEFMTAWRAYLQTRD